MVNTHESLAIAQVAFYVPIVPLAIWLLIRNWAYHPRMAWWPMVPLSLMRLVGGAITIALEKKPDDVGLIIGAIVLLNVGAIPLIVANWGQARIVIVDSLSEKPIYAKLMRAMRITCIVAAVLLVTGGSISSSSANTAKWLSLAGYILFAVVLGLLIMLELFLLTKRHLFVPSSGRVLTGCLLAAPFIIVRCVYGILEVVFGYNSMWDPLYGNVVAFALMALLCEYIAICIWLYVGFSMPPDRGVRGLAMARGQGQLKDVV